MYVPAIAATDAAELLKHHLFILLNGLCLHSILIVVHGTILKAVCRAHVRFEYLTPMIHYVFRPFFRVKVQFRLNQ